MAKYRNWGIVTVLAAMLVLVVRGDLVITGAELSGHVPGTPSSSSLNTDLISYWKMDETSGTRVDSEPTGTAQDLTDNNTVGYTNGISANAAFFVSSSSESLSKTNTEDLSIDNTSFSITGWVKLRDSSLSGNRYILSKTDSGTGDEYAIDINAGKFRFWIATNATYVIVTNTTSLSSETWYFIACVYDKDALTIALSVNNGSSASKSTSGTVPDNGGSSFRFGCYRTGSYSSFDIDEVGFWKRGLTSDEITELYNSGSGKTCCPF